MTEIKLSIRQAETVARYLRDKGQSQISAAVCRWKTPRQVAVMYLGSKTSNNQLSALEREIISVIDRT